MAINDISLTSGMRSNLFNLQGTVDLLNRTQQRLSTGKKVNSALDNPTSFFAAQSLNQRASDLSSWKDAMSNAVNTIQAADNGISAISSLIQAAKGIAQSALSTSDTTSITSYAAQYDEILTQITKIAGDSSYSGTNLLAAQNLTVKFDNANGDALQIQGFDATSNGLGINASMGAAYSDSVNPTLVAPLLPGDEIYTQGFPDFGSTTYSDAIFNDEIANPQNYELVSATGVALADGLAAYHDFHGTVLSGIFNPGEAVTMEYCAAGFNQTTGAANGPEVAIPTTNTGGNSWLTPGGIQSSITELDNAMTTLRNHMAALSANLSVVTTRQDFTNSMMNNLQTGADSLTLADMNQEGANMLMLQTKQSLGTTALSLSAQAAQAVLNLF